MKWTVKTPEAVLELLKRRGRPKKGEAPAEPKITRMDLQVGRSLQENVLELADYCTIGAKRNSKGHQETWIGYKLHIDTADGS